MATPTPTTAAVARTCFVTVGATASFNDLVEAVLSPSFLAALQKHAFTELIVQYGQSGQAHFGACLTETQRGVQVHGFDLDAAGLGTYLRRVGGTTSASDRNPGRRKQGVVISHAGSGTVLEVLRTGIPLIVVPNARLLDNHQEELASALAEQGYVVQGRVGELSKALDEAELLAERAMRWPPVNSGEHRGGTRGLKGVMDEEMGYLD